MAFSLEDYWVWDFWLADDGSDYHLFYLHAPISLVDPDLRHRNARIGHAVSSDLQDWTDHGPVLTPGDKGAFDETATWTGSVVRGSDGLWRMFYTGSSFISPDASTNIETIGVATSMDLHNWTKQPGPVLRADPSWYETLGTSSWPEEAWRDPWVFADPDGDGWHMLLTARVNHGEDSGRGVIGHAISGDLDSWQARPPLSAPQQGFGHLEVPQSIIFEGHPVVLFSCVSGRLTGSHAGRTGGIWVAPATGLAGPFDIASATLLVDQTLYAGRFVCSRDGRWMLMGFETGRPGEPFRGRVSDPIPLDWDDGNKTVVLAEQAA